MFWEIRLIACHSSLVAHMEQHSHTYTLSLEHKQFNKWRSSINRSPFLFLWYAVSASPLRKKEAKRNAPHQHTELQTPVKFIGTWVRNSETKTKAKHIYLEISLDEVIENRRIQFKLIAIKSGTDSNLLNVTSHAAGLLSMEKCSGRQAGTIAPCALSRTARICQNNDWASCLPTTFFIWFLFVCLR